MGRLTKLDKKMIYNCILDKYQKYLSSYFRQRERVDEGKIIIDKYNAGVLVKLGIRKRKSYLEFQFEIISMDMNRVMAEEVKKLLNKIKERWKMK